MVLHAIRPHILQHRLVNTAVNCLPPDNPVPRHQYILSITMSCAFMPPCQVMLDVTRPPPRRPLPHFSLRPAAPGTQLLPPGSALGLRRSRENTLTQLALVSAGGGRTGMVYAIRAKTETGVSVSAEWKRNGKITPGGLAHSTAQRSTMHKRRCTLGLFCHGSVTGLLMLGPACGVCWLPNFLMLSPPPCRLP